MPYWKTYFHIVTSTRNREPLIDDAVETILLDSIAQSRQDLGVEVHAIGAVPDHLHLVVSIPPAKSVAEVVKHIKGGASFRIGKALPTSGFGWQPEYGVLTFAERDLERVCRYVTNQKERHRTGNLNAHLERAESC